MGREIKRVPVDFNWPLQEPWPGYCQHYDHCPCPIHLPYEDYPEDKDCQVDRGSRCPYFKEVPTGEGWQVWETTSEGSPVSPVFETKGKLVSWLTKNGTGGMFDQLLSEEAAVAFADTGWAITGIMCNGNMYNGAEGAVACKKDKER